MRQREKVLRISGKLLRLKLGQVVAAGELIDGLRRRARREFDNYLVGDEAPLAARRYAAAAIVAAAAQGRVR